MTRQFGFIVLARDARTQRGWIVDGSGTDDVGFAREVAARCCARTDNPEIEYFVARLTEVTDID